MIDKTVQTIKAVFLTVYQPDGVRLSIHSLSSLNGIENSYIGSLDNAENVDGNKLHKYSLHPLTILSYFLGLPNHPASWSKKQSLLNLLYNFIGWQPYAKVERKRINAALMPLTILFNLLAVPFRAGVNLAKIFTEFLPRAIPKVMLEIEEDFVTYLSELKRHGFLIFLMLYLPLMFLTATAILIGFWVRAFYYLGFPITSPIKSMKACWNLNPGPGGFFLATLSLSVTVGMYALAFPLISGWLAPSVLPFLATHLPAGIITAGNATLNFLAPALAPIAQVAIVIGVLYLGIVTSGLGLIPAVPLILSPPAIAGLGSLVALFIGTIGIAISPCVDKFRHKWHTKGQELVSHYAYAKNNPANSDDVSSLTYQKITQISMDGPPPPEQEMTQLPPFLGNGPIRFYPKGTNGKIEESQIVPIKKKMEETDIKSATNDNKSDIIVFS